MIIYIIRHGETDWNVLRKFQGRTDIPLNENGRQVAAWTKEGLKDVAFDLVYTSPLRRAKETAQIIVGDRQIPIIEEERIIEMNFGSYEGVEARLQDDNLKRFFKAPEQYRAPEGGESIEEVLQRAGEFLEELYSDERLSNSTILMSTHGAMLSALMCKIKGVGVADFWSGGLYKNCGFSVIEVKEGKSHILKESVIAY